MRVAVVGCGEAGAQHCTAAVTAGGRLVAVCDSDANPARGLSARTGAPSRPLPHVLEDPAVEAVAICTPPDLHLPLGLEALSAGKAVVIEKPPALSREGVEELEAASRKHGRPIAVMFQHRGRLLGRTATSGWSANASAMVEVFRPRPRTRYASGTWRGDPRLSGGGFFAHLGIHYADLACQLLGEPRGVHVTVDAIEARGVDVRVIVSGRMANGAFLTVHASSLAADRHQRLCVLDGTRSLTIDDRESRYSEPGHEVAVPAPSVSDLRAMVYEELVAALRTGGPLRRFGLDSSFGSVSLLEQVAEALKQGAYRKVRMG